MMPSAPKSSARLALANWPTGIRTIAAPPHWRTWAIPETIEAVSHNPCWESSVTAGKRSGARSWAQIGAERPHQPLWTVSPALSRRAREKAVAVVMRSSFVVIRRAGGRCDGHHVSRLDATQEPDWPAGARDLQWPALIPSLPFPTSSVIVRRNLWTERPH